jgi:HSP20 family protein
MDSRQTWQPWQELRRLQREMEQLLGDVTPGLRLPLSGEYPPINLTREENGITVEALCPGVDRQSLDVTVVGDTLTVRGERKPAQEVSEERYHRRERPFGSFTRTISVGERLDPDGTQATYTQGILRVGLSRVPEATPKKIEIRA